MNLVPLFLIIVTLPLLFGGFVGKNKSSTEALLAESKPELEGVNYNELEERKGIRYLKNSDAPYTGKVFALYENGQKAAESNLKEGKLDGLKLQWFENGEKNNIINLIQTLH